MKRLTFGVAASLVLMAGGAAAETVRIGIMLPQTGVGAVLAKHMQSAYELALDHLGGKVGGEAAQITWGDSQGKADVARQLADEMVKSNRVHFMTGVLFSHEMMAVHGPVTRSGTFLIGPVAGPAPIAGASCSENFFSTSSQNDQQAEAMGEYLKQQGVKSVYAMTPNYQAGKDMIVGFKRTYPTEVAGETYTKFGQVDFAAELSMLRAAKPDATFIFYPGAMGIQYVKQYAQAGLIKNAPLFTVWTVDQASLPGIGDDAIGVRSANIWSVDLPNEANQRFVKDFQAKFGFLPNDYAAHSYDALMLIDSAVRAVGGNLGDRDKIRAALRKADFKSTRGKFKFNNNHFPIQDYYLREVVKDDKGVLVTKTIATILKDQPDVYAKDCPMKW